MLIFGLGFGLISLILIWSSVALFLLLTGHQLLSLRSSVVVGAAIISAILMLLPQQKQEIDQLTVSRPNFEIHDELFSIRASIIIGLSVSAVASLAVAILHCSEPLLAVPLQKLQYT